MRRERSVGRFDPLDQCRGFEPIIKFTRWIFMKLVFLLQTKFSTAFMLKPLRYEVILMPICDMKGDYLVVQGVSGSPWFFVTFGLYDYHLNKKVYLFMKLEKKLFPTT